MTLHLPTLNACLNGLAGVFLIAGYVAIKSGSRNLHRNLMLAAVATSALFLVSYLTYHFTVKLVTRYQGEGLLRPVYFFILISHSLLAPIVLPGSLFAIFRAWKGQFDKHVRITRWLWPMWVYVSITGVVIYVMLYGFH